MQYTLISGDNHIDLTYCPPELWSSQAPAKWKLLVPRVEELEDGLHWFVEGKDMGMWNGVGPEWRFLGLTRLLPSVHGLAAVGLSGGGTVSGVACTRVARSGPAGFPHGDARWPKEQ